MNEHEWNECREPQPMLEFLRNSGRLTERKARLVAAGCCRQIWRLFTDEACRRAVEVSETFADGLAPAEELRIAVAGANQVALATYSGGRAPDTAAYATSTAVDATSVHARTALFNTLSTAVSAAASAATRVVLDDSYDAEYDKAAVTASGEQCDLLRDLFGPLSFRPVPLAPASLSGAVQALAEVAYVERMLPSGILDPQRLAVLADAAEEAALPSAVVEHLRSPGPHYRGCWAVDLLLSKE